MFQTFLHQYNKPGFQSLYDEMSSRQKKKQQKEEEQKKVLENKTVLIHLPLILMK